MEDVNPSLVAEWVSRSHDRRALANLHRRLYPKIRAFISSRVARSEDAEDLAQDVFVELHKKNGWYEGLEDPEKYILGIARNIVRQYYRRRAKSIRTIPIEEIASVSDCHDRHRDSDPASRLEKQELTEAVEEVLTKLPPKARQALKSRFIDGLGPGEAARKAGCSVNSFYQRVHLGIRALAKLKIADLDVESEETKR